MVYYRLLFSISIVCYLSPFVSYLMILSVVNKNKKLVSDQVHPDNHIVHIILKNFFSNIFALK